jgi:hypothetical protein
MPRGKFAGRTTLGPEDDLKPGHVGPDSIKHPSNRDPIPKQPEAQMVVTANGDEVVVPGDAPLKEGSVSVGPVGAKPSTHRWVQSPDGKRYRWANSMPTKAGWLDLGPAE